MPKITMKMENYAPFVGVGFHSELPFKALTVSGFDGSPFGCIHAVVGYADIKIQYSPTFSTIKPSTPRVSHQLLSGLYGEDKLLVLGACEFTVNSIHTNDEPPHSQGGGFVFNAILTQVEKMCVALGLNIPKVNGYHDNIEWRTYGEGTLMTLAYGTGRQTLDFVTSGADAAVSVGAYYNPKYVLGQLKNSTDPFVNFNENTLFQKETTVVWVSLMDKTVRIIRGDVGIEEFMFGKEHDHAKKEST